MSSERLRNIIEMLRNKNITYEVSHTYLATRAKIFGKYGFTIIHWQRNDKRRERNCRSGEERERVREREIEANSRLKEDKRKRQVDKQERETKVSGPPLRKYM